MEVVSNSDQPENSDMKENENCHPMLQHETSTDNGEIAGQRGDNSGEYPVLRRGRKPNRPKPAKQKNEIKLLIRKSFLPKSKIRLSLFL